MSQNVMLYEAQFAFPDASQAPNDRPKREASKSILFTADGEVDAVQSAIRFYRTRQKAIPEYFGELWCIKVSMSHFGPVDAQGCILAQHSYPFFEWKHDRPGTLDDYADSFATKKELAELGGTEPDIKDIPRRRSEPEGGQ